ncbi:MAG: hypothetical protein KFF73_00020 [Cyclobacteriaceae bacterium]|nr:hypothetical protein [Cyclobacteriaceae bacterium]
MYRIVFSLLVVFIFGACSPEEPVFPPNPVTTPPEKFLKEYYEENNLMQSFEYDSNRLVLQKTYSSRGESSFSFFYGLNGRLDSTWVRQRVFPRDLYFHHEDSLITSFEVWNGGRIRQWVLFDRDNRGRIVRMVRVSLASGLLLDVRFEWDGANILKYEATDYRGLTVATYVYEFKYDEFRNPYRSVFHATGFNFIDYIPLTENNWLELTVYRKDDPAGTKVLYTNVFGYGGNYPFVKESTQVIDKVRRRIYAEYKY